MIWFAKHTISKMRADDARKAAEWKCAQRRALLSADVYKALRVS